MPLYLARRVPSGGVFAASNTSNRFQSSYTPSSAIDACAGTRQQRVNARNPAAGKRNSAEPRRVEKHACEEAHSAKAHADRGRRRGGGLESPPCGLAFPERRPGASFLHVTSQCHPFWGGVRSVLALRWREILDATVPVNGKIIVEQQLDRPRGAMMVGQTGAAGVVLVTVMRGQWLIWRGFTRRAWCISETLFSQFVPGRWRKGSRCRTIGQSRTSSPSWPRISS